MINAESVCLVEPEPTRGLEPRTYRLQDSYSEPRPGSREPRRSSDGTGRLIYRLRWTDRVTSDIKPAAPAVCRQTDFLGHHGVVCHGVSVRHDSAFGRVGRACGEVVGRFDARMTSKGSIGLYLFITESTCEDWAYVACLVARSVFLTLSFLPVRRNLRPRGVRPHGFITESPVATNSRISAQDLAIRVRSSASSPIPAAIP
jgi:hypothetical protein